LRYNPRATLHPQAPVLFPARGAPVSDAAIYTEGFGTSEVKHAAE